MGKPTNQLMSLNSEILAGLTIEELEDRLELQVIGLLEVLSVYADTCNTCNTCNTSNTGGVDPVLPPDQT